MGTRRTVLPDIPDAKTLDEAIEALGRHKETLEVGLGRRGDPLDAFVSFRDLKDGGIAGVGFAGSARGGLGRPVIAPLPDAGPGGGPLDFGEDDPTKPPRPTNVVARGLSLDTIMVRWDPPGYNNHSHAEIYGSFRNDLNEVRATFDPTRPTGPDNLSPYLMGTSNSTQFLHEELLSTVPVLTTQFAITNVSYLQTGGLWYLRASMAPGLSPTLFSIGEEVGLRDDEGQWELHGTTQLVDQVVLGPQGNVQALRIGPVSVPADPSSSTPATSFFVLKSDRSADELDAALEPSPIYYWVRFVSTAQVVGEFQSEEGVVGTVQVDPEAVLNILTNRINTSQLANDLRAPIDWTRGPLTEINPDGTRKYPTVRAFVESLGDARIAAYDEALEQIFLGFLSGDTPLSMPVMRYRKGIGNATIELRLQAGATPATLHNTQWLWQGGGEVVGALDGKTVILRDVAAAVDADGITQMQITRADGSSSFPGTTGEWLVIDATLNGNIVDPAAFDGIASAAAYLRQLTGEASESEAFFRSLEALEAAFEDGGDLVTGIRQIIATVTERRLVNASDAGAIAEIDNQVGLLVDAGGAPPAQGFNQTLSQVTADSDGRLRNAYTVKLQQTLDGLLYTAGFGLALEQGTDGEVNSQFIVSADDFAIVSPVAKGVRVVGWFVGGTPTSVQVLTDRELPTEWFAAQTDDRPWTRDLALSVTRDVDHPGFALFDGFRKNVWRYNSPAQKLAQYTVSQPQFDEPGPGPFTYFRYRIDVGQDLTGIDVVAPPVLSQRTYDDAPATYKRPAIEATGAPDFLALSGVLAYASSVPFVVDTARNLVGIRGHLVVDGMISADNVEVNELLTANQIWARYVTAYGLNAQTIVSDQIATYRRGGWALRIKSPDGGDNKVLRLSRWLTSSDPDVSPDQILDGIDNLAFPQLTSSPAEDAFFLDATTGSVYMRGGLEVGGEARIWTGGGLGPLDSANWVVQMDNTFPIQVTRHTDLETPVGDPEAVPKYVTLETVKRKALMWLAKDGTAGFNTANDAIYLDDEPLQMPGAGGTSVIYRGVRRLGVGNTRVFCSASFVADYGSNPPLGTDRFLAINYALWLWPVSQPYPGTKLAGGDVVAFRSQAGDPYPTYQATMQQHGRFVAQAFTNNGQHHYQLQGAADNVPPGVPYRVLMVVIERFDSEGELPFPSQYYMPRVQSPSFFAQQVSRTEYNFSNNAYKRKVSVVSQDQTAGDHGAVAFAALARAVRYRDGVTAEFVAGDQAEFR